MHVIHTSGQFNHHGVPEGLHLQQVLRSMSEVWKDDNPVERHLAVVLPRRNQHSHRRMDGVPRVRRYHPQRREDIHASKGGMEGLQREGRQGCPGLLSPFILCACRMDRMEGLCQGACRGAERTGGQEGRTPPHLHEHHRRPSLLQGSHRLVGVEGHL